MRHFPNLFGRQADPVYHAEVGPEVDLTSKPISPRVQENKDFLLTLFTDARDLVIQEFMIHTTNPHPAIVVYIEGLNDPVRLQQHVLHPLLELTGVKLSETTSLLDALEKEWLPIAKLPRVQSIGDVLDTLLDGEAVLLIEGKTSGLSFPVRTWPGRDFGTPESEPLVRGPHEAFCECLQKNHALLRERLKTPDFKSERLIIGRYTKSWVKVFYIQGIVKPELVAEVKQRLAQIQIDGIIDAGYIEELIEDTPWSPFPQIDQTERPDKVAAALLSGQVAIMVDKSPSALIVPVTFFHFFAAAEDYYIRSLYGTALRIIRFIALWLALLLPSVYIAVTTFHMEMVPNDLAISLAAQREHVPFPAIVEALLMEIVFEILREL